MEPAATGHYYGYKLLLMALIIGINGFFAAAETALVSVRPSRLKALAEEGVLGAQAALSLLARPERLLSVSQVGLTLASLALGWIGEETLYALFQAGLASWFAGSVRVMVSFACFGLAFVVLTYLHVVVGEVVPKNVAIAKADRMAVIVAPVLLVFYRIAEPFVRIIEKSAAGLSRLAGIRGSLWHAGGHSAEELRYVVTASHGAGQISEFEGEAMLHLMELRTLSAREVMTPRNQLVMIPASADIDDALRILSESRYSRFPVFDEESEKIIGVVHVKDVLDFWTSRRLSNQRRQGVAKFDLPAIARKVPVVPETKALIELLEDLRVAHAHMAIVVDEFGAIAGLITMEDVLEQVFGEIEDEFDPQPKAATGEVAEPHTLELDGGISIRDLDTQFDLDLPEDLGFETLAGFLLFRLGRLPEVGEQVVENGRRYTVLEREMNRIARVRVEKL